MKKTGWKNKKLRSALAMGLAAVLACTTVVPSFAEGDEIRLINDLGGYGGADSVEAQMERDWNKDMVSVAKGAWLDAHAGEDRDRTKASASSLSRSEEKPASPSDMRGGDEASAYDVFADFDEEAAGSAVTSYLKKAKKDEKKANGEFLRRMLKEAVIPEEGVPRDNDLRKEILALDKMNDEDYDIFHTEKEYTPAVGDILFVAGHITTETSPASSSDAEKTADEGRVLKLAKPAEVKPVVIEPATQSELAHASETSVVLLDEKTKTEEQAVGTEEAEDEEELTLEALEELAKKEREKALKRNAKHAVLAGIIIAGPEENQNDKITFLYSTAKDKVEIGVISRNEARIIGFADMEQLHDKYCGILEELEEEQEEEALLEEEALEKEEVPNEKTEYTWKTKNLTVTATLTDPETIPDDAELVVTPVTDKTNGYNYQAYMDALTGEISSADDENTILYDVAFLVDEKDENGEKTGRTIELQPENDKVRVSFRFDNAKLTDEIGAKDSEKVKVVHLPLTDTSKASAETTKEASGIKADDISPELLEAQVAVGTKSGKVEFETDGFSVFAFVYTVDFHWEVNGKTYDFSIPGGGFISLQHLVEVLGLAEDSEKNGTSMDEENASAPRDEVTDINSLPISESTKKFVADVENVSFSNPELVWIGKAENETTVGILKEQQKLDVQYSTSLTEEQIAEINAQTVKAGDWALISVRPFTSNETLTVTMKNGDRFTVKVTDAQINDSYNIYSGNYYYVYTVSNDVKYALSYDGKAAEIIDENSPSLGNDYIWQFTWDGSYWFAQNVGHPEVYIDPKHENVTSNDYNGLTITNRSDGNNGFDIANWGGDPWWAPWRFITLDTSTNSFKTADQGSSMGSRMLLLDALPTSEKPRTIETADTSKLLKINLFDYGPEDMLDDVTNNIESQTAYSEGLNSHPLKFYSYGTLGDSINHFTGNGTTGIEAVHQGIVADTLVDLETSPYPYLNADKNADNSDESLGYLFDVKGSENVKPYTGLNHLFTLDEDGYYRYDSNKNYAFLDGKDFKVYEETFKEEGADNLDFGVGFFPFNDYNKYCNCIHGRNFRNFNDWHADDKEIAKVGHYNHHFGMSISGYFTMPPDGKYNGEDVKYEFSGDDDMWVFIDGVLILDIGGIHNPASGSINFTTGEVEVNGVSQTNLKDKYKNVTGKDWDDSAFSNHDFRVFYMERGGMYSNLAVTFNLPLTEKQLNIDVEKLWESGGETITPPAGAEVEVVLGRNKLVEKPEAQGTGTLVIKDSYSGLPAGSAYEVAYTIEGPDNYSYTFNRSYSGSSRQIEETIEDVPAGKYSVSKQVKSVSDYTVSPSTSEIQEVSVPKNDSVDANLEESKFSKTVYHRVRVYAVWWNGWWNQDQYELYSDEQYKAGSALAVELSHNAYNWGFYSFTVSSNTGWQSDLFTQDSSQKFTDNLDSDIDLYVRCDNRSDWNRYYDWIKDPKIIDKTPEPSDLPSNTEQPVAPPKDTKYVPDEDYAEKPDTITLSGDKWKGTVTGLPSENEYGPYKYYIASVKESGLPNGIDCVCTIPEERVTYDSTTKELIVKNNVTTSLKILKINQDTKAPLAGATFTLTQEVDENNEANDENGRSIVQSEKTTDENGELTFKDLTVGTRYKLEETKVPDGYTKKEGLNYIIQINEDGTAELEKTDEWISQDGNKFTIGNDPVPPEVCTENPSIEKVIKGNAATDEMFTFRMTAVDPVFPMPEGAVDGVKEITAGKGRLKFGEITYTKPGTYIYTVREIAGNNSDCKYDTTLYTKTTVVEERDGKLVITSSTYSRDGVATETATFTNVYTTPDPEPTPGPEPKPDPEPTPDPAPTPDPTPTPAPEPTPVPPAPSNGGSSGGGSGGSGGRRPRVTQPAQDPGEVLGAARDSLGNIGRGVLGALREPGQQVLGAARTGDYSHMAAWLAVFMSAVAGLWAVLRRRKKKSSKK